MNKDAKMYVLILIVVLVGIATIGNIYVGNKAKQHDRILALKLAIKNADSDGIVLFEKEYMTIERAQKELRYMTRGQK